MVPVVIRCIRGCDPQAGGMVPAGTSELCPEECSHGYAADVVQNPVPSPACGTRGGQQQSTGGRFVYAIHPCEALYMKSYVLTSFL